MLLIVAAFSLTANAQSYRLSILTSAEDSIKVGIYKKRFNTPSDRQQVLNGVIENLFSQSYLSAGYDSIAVQDTFMTAALHVGEQYKWAAIRPGNIRQETLQEAGLRETYWFNKPVSNKGLLQMYNMLLDYYENNGYPFAEISLDSVEFSGNTVTGYLNATLNKLIVFDTIQIKGSARLKQSYIQQYLGIKAGAPYSEAAYRKADQKLRNLPFATPVKSTDILFITDKARPVLYINERKSDQVNGIIGLAPGGGTGPNASKLLLTGEFKIKLNNLFRSGKVFELNWRSFKARSQELKTNLQLPYLFHTQIGTDFRFDLLKYDTLYTTVGRQFGLQYQFNGLSSVKVYYNVNSTSLITVDTLSLRFNKALPSTNSTISKNYGISGTLNTLDYIFNPRKGYQVTLDVSAGNRRVRRDPRINDIEFTDGSGHAFNLYDSSELKTAQYRLKYNAEKFFPVGKTSAFRIASAGEHLESKQIYFNEVLRFGGFSTLRGFNEQSIFATSYSLLIVEYRYLFAQNSFIQVFWNGAYYEDRNIQRASIIHDTPWGFGVGANLDTGAGILSIAYALGKEKSNNFDLRTGKIHFGLSSYF
ncbi:MAG: hypothetical protein H7321_03060 [Bacteroidia bacterium]|nr:hypothetical protein [Bacteroidia bacterium]